MSGIWKKKIESIHFDSDFIASPVTADTHTVPPEGFLVRSDRNFADNLKKLAVLSGHNIHAVAVNKPVFEAVINIMLLSVGIFVNEQKSDEEPAAILENPR